MDPTLRHITDRIQTALAQRTPLRIRGGGSKDFYGQSLRGELLDVSAWRGIISYAPSELVVTVRAGTPLAELQAALAEQGQCLAFEPPCFGTTGDVSNATVGGMVAAGLSGPARASAGAVREFVLGVKVLNGRAELLTFGGQVIKNVAGYDVSRLMVGALGTLGLLTEISLKVLPLAPAQATLVCAGLSQQTALDVLNRWGGQPLPLNASCWLFDDTVSPPCNHLFVRLRGAAAAVAAAAACMSVDLQALGGDVNRIDNAQADADWAACRDQTLPFFKPPTPEFGLWRLSLPQTAAALNLPYPQLVEWHGGQRWLWAPLSALAQLRQAAADAGGSATLFRAPQDGLAEPVTRFSPLEQAVGLIHRRLKHEFDPLGIFNPGRLVAEW
jgi:glycolate oxidase FAD binding subunit